MWTELLNSSYFALFLIVALGFMLGRIKIRGVSLDVSAVIFIASGISGFLFLRNWATSDWCCSSLP
jgi:uncharacterized transporter YbjL